MAKNLDATIVLMYATPQMDIPPELLEYSRKEKNPDIEADFLNSIGLSVAKSQNLGIPVLIT
jgi:hypothetical protein